MENNDSELYLIKYNKALELLQNKFNQLYLDYEHNSNDNPIEHIKSRIKDSQSIKEKIKKKLIKNNIDTNNIILSEELIDKYLSDVVGIRLVCSFKNDLEEIINIIKKDKELTIIDEKDYITNPKSNGYKSYHIRVEIPVEVNGKKEKVKAEIQLRTIAMDMNASLEHILRYKKDVSLPEDVMDTLKDTANFCNELDEELKNEIIKRKDIKDNKVLVDLNSISDEDFNKIIPKYDSAIKVIEEKLKHMREEYKKNNLINPIEHINIRIKDKEATLRKLNKLKKDLNIENIEEYINDMAGIRVVCPFKQNVNDLVKELKNDKELLIQKEKNYVTNPKESGYRSYHLIVLVPIYTEMGKIYVKSEIQIRSMAMDMWASLERKLAYKKDVNLEIKKTLQEKASKLAELDDKMDNSYQKSLSLQQEKERKMQKIELLKLKEQLIPIQTNKDVNAFQKPYVRVRTQKKITVC